MSDINLPQADLEITVKDRDGNIVYQQEGPSHSWVKNFYQLIYCQCAGVHATTTTYSTHFLDLSGTTLASNFAGGGYDYTTPFGWDYDSIGSDARGLWIEGYRSDTGCQVGTGTGLTTESFTDYTLDGICKSGTDANCFVFTVGTRLITTSTAGTVLKHKIDRTFTNNSGNTIAVTESGLYGRINIWSSVYNIMFNRDTFGTINVANGNSLYVAYTIKLTLPYAIHS